MHIHSRTAVLNFSDALPNLEMLCVFQRRIILQCYNILKPVIWGRFSIHINTYRGRDVLWNVRSKSSSRLT